MTPDHLERHGSFDEYARLKARIFENQKEGDCAVLNYDDPFVRRMSGYVKSDVYYFSAFEKVRGAYVENGKIYFSDGEKSEYICRADEMAMTGAHNLSNALAAVAVAKVYGTGAGYVARALRRFKPPRYRIELVKVYKNMKIYNDSKATNIDSTVKACEAMDGDTALIMGGWDKRISYESFFSRVPSKVRHIVCCGDNSDEIIKWMPEDADYSVIKTATLERAVEISLAYPDVTNLLFSPSTSSFDRYTDYRQRGRHFDEIIKAFANG